MSADSALNSLVSTGSAIVCTSKWSLTSPESLGEYACSATRGGKGRTGGIQDWSGSWTAFGATAAVDPGDSIATLTLVKDGTAGSQNGYSGPAIVEYVEIQIDIENGGVISHTVGFQGNGQLTPSATLNVSAPTGFPSPGSGKLCKIQIATPAASPSFNDVGAIRTATLRMSVALFPYCSSDEAPYRKRVAGTFDASLSATCWIGDPTDLPTRGSTYHVRLFVDGSTYYDIKWARVSNIGPIDCDRSTGAPVGGTFEALLDGFTDYAAASHGGWIKNPAGTAIWDGST